MTEPARIESIVRAVRQAVSVPVTIKTRLGLSPARTTVFEVAQAAEEAGAAAIAIHARYATEKHNGAPHWEPLAAVRAQRHIPVIGNGGINRAHDALAMLDQTGVDGVMVGKAAIGNPWIFREISALLRGDVFTRPTLEERRDLIREHLARLVAHKATYARYHRPRHPSPQRAAALHFRSHLLRYVAGLKGCSDIRRSLQELRDPEQISAAVDAVIARQ